MHMPLEYLTLRFMAVSPDFVYSGTRQMVKSVLSRQVAQ